MRQSSLISPPPTPVQRASSDWSNDTSGKDCQHNTGYDEERIEQAIAKRKSKKFIQTYAKHIHTLRPVADPCCHDNNNPHGRRYDDKPFRFNNYPVTEPRHISRSCTPSIITLQPRNGSSASNKIGDANGRPSGASCFMSDRNVTPKSQKRKESTLDTKTSDMTKKKIKLKSKSHDTKSAIDKNTLFDKIDLDQEDAKYFSKDWVPSSTGLGRIPVKVTWKGSALSIHGFPYYDRLHQIEANMASTLRLTPAQYLRCKRTLISTAQQFYLDQMTFRKSDAQKVCRVDVNKTSALWVAFDQLGWFAPNRT